MVPYSFTHGEKLYMIWRKTPEMKVEYLIDPLNFTTVIEVDVPTQEEIATLIPSGTPTPKFTPLEMRFVCRYPDQLMVWPFGMLRISKEFPNLTIDGLILNINKSGVLSSRC